MAGAVAARAPAGSTNINPPNATIATIAAHDRRTASVQGPSIAFDRPLRCRPEQHPNLAEGTGSCVAATSWVPKSATNGAASPAAQLGREPGRFARNAEPGVGGRLLDGSDSPGDSLRRMLEQGTQAPDFDLPDQDGSPVKLSDLKGQTVVLYFYRKADT
jgi:hypothetical protein